MEQTGELRTCLFNMRTLSPRNITSKRAGAGLYLQRPEATSFLGALRLITLSQKLMLPCSATETERQLKTFSNSSFRQSRKVLQVALLPVFTILSIIWPVKYIQCEALQSILSTPHHIGEALEHYWQTIFPSHTLVKAGMWLFFTLIRDRSKLQLTQRCCR